MIAYRLASVSGRIVTIPDDLKTQEMCNEAVQMEPCSLVYVPDHFKTQEMCNTAVCMEPLLLKYVPDFLKAQKMCEKSH